MKIVIQPEEAAWPRRIAARSRRAAIRRDAVERRVRGLTSALCLAAIAVCGCGYAGTPPGAPGIPVESGGGATIAISVSPPTASVPSGGAQVFTASVSGTTNTGVTWSVNGIAGGNSTIGTIAGAGADTATYIAPSAPPSPATVTVAATSAEDTSKSGSASVTITCGASNAISPSSANVALSQTQNFSAAFCLAAGQSITWDVNGIAGGDSTLGTIAASGPTSALYTAPADLPLQNPMTVHAVVSPQPSGGPESTAATVTVTGGGITVSISPPTATLAATQHAMFAATVANTQDATVTWAVNDIPNGNATVGQVCLSGSGACVAPSAPVSGGIFYFAPASTPSSGSVTLTAASHADPSRNSSATIFFLGAASAWWYRRRSRSFLLRRARPARSNSLRRLRGVATPA